MRLLTILYLIAVSTEAKKRRIDGKKSKIHDGTPKNSDVIEAGKLIENKDKDTFQYPVPFGHIFQEGFGDPTGEVKQPIDMVELDTVYLKDGPLAKELIRKQGKHYQILKKKHHNTAILSPKDSFLNDENVPEEKNVTTTFWDLAGMLNRNIENPLSSRMRKRPVHALADVGPDYRGKSEYFTGNSFGLKVDERKFNFTTCEEFGKRAKFHPNDIVHLDWVPFYVWGYDITGKDPVARIHRFTYPTKKLVIKFKNEIGSHLNKTIDWEQPKLILRNDIAETLLVAVDRKGLFDGIPYTEMTPTLKRSGVQMPMTSIQLKIVDPYLAMMYCDHQHAYIMAVSGNEPITARMKISEAATLKLQGPGLPIRRDLNVEQIEERAKKLEELMKERSKFIEVVD